ncbi:probable membrane-associated kinase regulator 1 [Syzygium oleosum]|uniref:probable membrane-associated kinase regulator 1 n=1 Tax=Syzygium oleosum TaxID=219896 RepID=UPI0011D26F2F|nr:probable membrane-associated kinase regulator 1 [Syzygium oleosum]
MEIHRNRNGSSDGFSFPSTPESQDPDLEFEFGCATPDSPSGESNKNSPADHLFFNGRLLPHSFPCKTMTNAVVPRAASRASSVSSRDSMSLTSSRSNSTNSSRSSSCSSTRRSSSDNTERARSPVLMYQTRISSNNPSNNARDQRRRTSQSVAAQVYGTSHRWQFIAPVPPLSREGSCSSSSSSSRRGMRKLCEGVVREEVKRIKEKERTKTGFGKKLIRSFLLSCMQCHAMEVETSRREDVFREL